MARRKIIEINRDLCDGCGLCTTACAEGALELDAENKAVLVKDIYCDGMGACLDVCPTGALKIVERDGAAYNVQAAYKHVLATRGKEAARHVQGFAEDLGDHHRTRRDAGAAAPPACGCPGSLAGEIEPAGAKAGEGRTVSGASQLSQWPIQLHLISPLAPYFKGSDLLIAADCTAFSLGSFHPDLLKGRRLVIACPKLDDTTGYVAKLAELIRLNGLKSLTVAVMTVPCCSGLLRMVRQAVEDSGLDIPVDTIVIGIDGKIAALPAPRSTARSAPGPRSTSPASGAVRGGACG
ncbi:MAG: 4Fe-4S dicluster domain-containing protein [Candidatus Aminicenantes bacterium]|nr:4Fe-4S dicluster domain-containing protein [Candidatus Aminicenantes bacterium]